MKVYDLIIGDWDDGHRVKLDAASVEEIRCALNVGEFKPDGDAQTSGEWDEQARIILSLKQRGLMP